MQKWLRKWVRKFEKPLTVLAGAASLSFLLLNFDFNFLEANLYDMRVSRSYSQPPNPEIALITLDDNTIKTLDEFAPLPLKHHIRFLEKIAEYQPKAIGYLIDMNPVFQMKGEATKAQVGKLVSAIQNLKNQHIPFLLGTPFDVTGEVLPPVGLEGVDHAIAVVHKDGNVFAEDKVTRRALLSLYERPSFHLLFARKTGAIGENEFPPGTFYVPQVDGKYFFFRYHQSTMVCRENCSHQYNRYSFADVLTGKISPDLLKNKLVLVGTLSSDDSSDYALTPYAKTAFLNPKIVVHADILDSILKKEGILRIPGAINTGVTFIVTSIVLWWILTSTPLWGVFATLSLALTFIIVSHLLFQFYGWWIRESQPLVGIFVSYYLAVPYRLIREYKKRWDYQRKHEILMQVEELKTNFLNLVTHDLKTPVARIQGLAEVLMKRTGDRLLPPERETLKNIFSSTEELNHFISSILELSKVESNRLQIQLASRDINQLIEKSITDLQTLATHRRIKIHSNLEPLFPIKIDPALISKVINNLIDNAIKYSPEGGEIQVRSYEEDDWLVVSVQDQGIGMSEEEKQNLFTRFYRAKNDTTTMISGTGLGLYLTKYFVEAHRGFVDVDTQKGKGSTFRIYLPLSDATINKLPKTHSTFFKDKLDLAQKENSDVSSPSGR
ncbi:MAG: CHASE2 domain-containing protein [Bdellovibrio sp.]|nr:CHASE2 domain-containing protein [Bdellovibrio sp.]